MIAALVTSLAFGGGLVVLGFCIGRAYERQPTAPVYVLPPSVVRRHPSHSRPAHHERTASRHLRVVTPNDFYDWSQEDSPA